MSASTVERQVAPTISSPSHTPSETPPASRPAPAHRVVIAAEGSGGHLIPALEVASQLTEARVHVTLLYPHRAPMSALLAELVRGASAAGVDMRAVHPHTDVLPRFVARWAPWLARCDEAVTVWHLAREQFTIDRPAVVVGFGGGFCVPVIVAAAGRRIPTMLHEQNVTFGRANRWLVPWVDRIAVSFEATASTVASIRRRRGVPDCITTGLPIRPGIGVADRCQAAQRFGVDPDAPTVLVLGGSQGSRSINGLMAAVVGLFTDDERAGWQVIHLAGSGDVSTVRRAYEAARMRRTWVEAHCADMAQVYALADVAVGRAGASTIAELAHCGIPAVFIPYPYARSHQRDNARLVESIGGGVQLDEAAATPERVAILLRQLLCDEPLRRAMSAQIRTLDAPQAAAQLSNAILQLIPTRTTPGADHNRWTHQRDVER